MKRISLFFLQALVAALLIGCAAAPVTYTVERNGTAYIVNTELGIISDDLYTYLYEVEGSGDRRSVTITYPDGPTYTCSYNGSGAVLSWSNDYSPNRYADGDTLLAVLEAQAPKEYSGHPILGLLLIALGIWHTLAPRAAWYLSYGWRYKNAEPSDAALLVSRISGIAVVIFGLYYLFLS